MADQTIVCPYCKREIALTEAITGMIKEDLRKEFARDKADIEKAAKSKVEKEYSVKIRALEDEVSVAEKKLEEAQQAELGLRKERAELESRAKSIDLEVARKVDEERKTIQEEAIKKADEEHLLKDKEKDRLIGDMKKQIDDLKRKAEQGSQQAQGEVLEVELEGVLKTSFPFDMVEPVPKGIRGADVIHKINNQVGQHCGSIIWESKYTKNWSEGWIDKLKDDQRSVKAEIAVLLSVALPKEINCCGYYKGVWITNHSSLTGLASALRSGLIEAAGARQASLGKHEKMEAIYDYLSGPVFRQKIEAIVETFVHMKNDLDGEKRAMGKLWAKREKQIERVIKNVVGMHGEMEGIIGASLPKIDSMELKALTFETDTEEAAENEQ
jgi:hypothetical protein